MRVILILAIIIEVLHIQGNEEFYAFYNLLV